MLDKKTIAAKDIYIFESHAYALVAWGIMRQKLPKPPFLLTLDHHTDSHTAFLANYGLKVGAFRYNEDEYNEHRSSLISQIDYNDEASLHEAVAHLKNDEHIDAAILSNIINSAFVISHSNDHTRSIEEDHYFYENYHGLNQIRTMMEGPRVPFPKRPFTYSIPKSRIFKVDSTECFEHDNRYTDEHVRPHFDLAIESDYLNCKLSILNEMAKTVGVDRLENEQYILDIDLDYFKTKKGIHPFDNSSFINLIKHSVGVTIATEPWFVNELRLDDDIDSDYLLNEVLKHVEAALIS